MRAWRTLSVGLAALLVPALPRLADRSTAQPLLTVQEAVETALAANPEVRAARAQAAIDRANNTAGNAGQLPELSLRGAGTQRRTWTEQELASQDRQETDTGRQTGLSAGLELDWTLYDGGGMPAARRRLAQLEAQGGARLRDQSLQVVYQTVAAYYDIVRARQQLASVEEALAVNRERVRILATGVAAGQTPRTQLLQAQIDLNTYEGQRLTQEEAIRSRHRTLSLIMGQDPARAFAVTDTIPLPATLPDTTDVLARNPAVEMGRRQLGAAEAALQEARAERLPTLSLGADYSWQRTAGSAGQVHRSSSSGPQAGLSLSVPVYAAGNLARRERVAALQVEAARLTLEAEQRLVRLQALEAFAQFHSTQRLLELEEASAQLARENLEIARERLCSGQSTAVEFRQAQEDWVDAATRRVNHRYELALSELRLRQLMGELGPPP